MSESFLLSLLKAALPFRVVGEATAGFQIAGLCLTCVLQSSLPQIDQGRCFSSPAACLDGAVLIPTAQILPKLPPSMSRVPSRKDAEEGKGLGRC